MAEIRTVTTLRYKRAEIEKSIENYEKRLAQAQPDLAHINALSRFSRPAATPRASRPTSNGEPQCRTLRVRNSRLSQLTDDGKQSSRDKKTDVQGRLRVDAERDR
jgi:hypothetical protein